jgi:hypothetical protein
MGGVRSSNPYAKRRIVVKARAVRKRLDTNTIVHNYLVWPISQMRKISRVGRVCKTPLANENGTIFRI